MTREDPPQRPPGGPDPDPQAGPGEAAAGDAVLAAIAHRLRARSDRQQLLTERLRSGELRPGALADLAELAAAARRGARDGDHILVLAGAPRGPRLAAAPTPLGQTLSTVVAASETASRTVVPPTPSVSLDAAAEPVVVQILAELLAHAGTVTPPGERIELHTRWGPDGGVVLEVQCAQPPRQHTPLDELDRALSSGRPAGPVAPQEIGLHVAARLARAIGARLGVRGPAGSTGVAPIAVLQLPTTVVGGGQRPEQPAAPPPAAPDAVVTAATARPAERPEDAETPWPPPADTRREPAPAADGARAGADPGPDRHRAEQPGAVPAPGGPGPFAVPRNGTPPAPEQVRSGPGTGPHPPGRTGPGPQPGEPGGPVAPAAAAPGGPGPGAGPTGPPPPGRPPLPVRNGQRPPWAGDPAAGPGPGPEGTGPDGAGGSGPAPPARPVPGGGDVPPVTEALPLAGSTPPVQLFGPFDSEVPVPVDDLDNTPIFAAVASAWFREPAGPETTALPVTGNGTTTPAPDNWRTPGDAEFDAARIRADRVVDLPTTAQGLPQRRPGQAMVPPSWRDTPNGAEPSGSRERHPDRVRTRLASYQRGLREGRHRAGEDHPEPGPVNGATNGTVNGHGHGHGHGEGPGPYGRNAV